MDKEASPLLEKCVVNKTTTYGFAKVYECLLENRPLLIAISGIGKAFAASCIASVLATHHEVNEIINVGVAGSTDGKKAPIFSAVIASELFEHDLDTSAIGDPIGMVSGLNIVSIPVDKGISQKLEKACEKASIAFTHGPISSGDTFFNHDDPRREHVIKTFGSLSLDMESAPFGQIAAAHSTSFGVLRVVSDCENPAVEYAKNANEAGRIACEVAKQYILL